ncbi:MAG: hypothetical protein P8H45_01510 [Flavobacteriaceae bacterium]|nr:hypothetical protein [Flavobacteriaceae bacterium]
MLSIPWGFSVLTGLTLGLGGCSQKVPPFFIERTSYKKVIDIQ